MIEYRIVPVVRHDVIRYSDEHPQVGTVTVASNLNESQADDVLGAMFERARSADMVVLATKLNGEVLEHGCATKIDENDGY